MTGYFNNLQEQNGDAIIGATIVALSYPGGIEVARTVTDNNGMYYFNVPSGAYTFAVYLGLTLLKTITNIQIGGDGGAAVTPPAVWDAGLTDSGGTPIPLSGPIASFVKIGKLVSFFGSLTFSGSFSAAPMKILMPSAVDLTIPFFTSGECVIGTDIGYARALIAPAGGAHVSVNLLPDLSGNSPTAFDWLLVNGSYYEA